jgi:hypothetical protein
MKAISLVKSLIRELFLLSVAFAGALLLTGVSTSTAGGQATGTPAKGSGGLVEIRPERRTNSWYKFAALDSLIEEGAEFDGKGVSAFGKIEFDGDVAYLGNPFKASSLNESVCIEESASQEQRVLRQLRSLSVGVYGVYRRASDAKYQVCRNGTIRLEGVQISFE